MNKTYLIVFFLAVVIIFGSIIYMYISTKSIKTEKFENVLISQLYTVKNFISNYLDNDSNLEEPYVLELLNHFDNSQNESLENRLNKFKENLSNTDEFDKSILDELYFDLRMNEDQTVRNKLICGYKIVSDYIKNNNLNIDSDINIVYDDNFKKILINLIKKYAKSGTFE